MKRLVLVVVTAALLAPAVIRAGAATPGPTRPSACPPVPANQGGPGSERQSLKGTVPWPGLPAGVDPQIAVTRDHTAAVTPPVRPANWSSGGADWKLTSARSTDRLLAMNPQELCGVKGSAVDTAWQVTTGRPDTVIAVTDSGIEWCRPSIVDKIYVNRRALPLPEDGRGRTKPQLQAAGVSFPDADPYDLLGTGVFNVEQYRNDPRITKPYFCKTFISPADLIRTFGRDGRADPPGFTEAISGWNFVDDNNNPYDDVHYGHGSGEAEDSTGAANSLGNGVGVCPNCMVLPIRVGQSFIAEGSEFARAVLFAVDSGASVIQEALGTMDETTAAAQAIQYADRHGVPVIASAADEEAAHHNEPGNLPGTIVVNSVTQAPTQGGVPLYLPASYLLLNGCTNYGANIAVTVESSSCSSEATGKAGGVTGLVESAARTMLETGRLAPYPGVTAVGGRPVPLSTTEVRELITMAANDIDFRTAAPPFGPPDNYVMVAPVPTTRYPTQPGFDVYTGYGRMDAGRILSWLARGTIPPEASFGTMQWFKVYDPTTATVRIDASAAATRTPGRPFGWQLQYGLGTQPESWTDISHGAAIGTTSVRATLGPDVLRRIASQTHPAVGPAGQPQPDGPAFTLRLVVTDADGRTGMDRRTEYLQHDATLLTAGAIHPGGSVDAPPTLAPIGPNHTNALIVATADGQVHAYQPRSGTLIDLPGWPVATVPFDSHLGEPAYTSGEVTSISRGSILGGVAVGDLFGTGQLDVVASDMTGRVYAWDPGGKLLPQFPMMTNPAFSSPSARDRQNRLLPGIIAAPALAHLESAQQLDIVASSMDRHVYAWRPDGRPVPGWPVLLVDRTQTTGIDPVTHHVTFAASAHGGQGAKVVDTPAIGAISGSGRPDVIVDTNEEYGGTLNVSALNVVNWALGQVPLLNPANSRVYALTAAGALRKGWPVPIADLDSELLPDVGDGSVASPALADLAGNGKLEVGVMTTVGPGYILKPDGTSYLGTGPDGKPIVLASVGTGPLANSVQYPTIPALGAPLFAPLGGLAPGISFIAPATSLHKALDAALPDRQLLHDNQLDAWNTTTGTLQPAFPQVMNDLQFLVQPIVANLDRGGPYVVSGSAESDIRAINASGNEAPGFPKFTGDWMVQSPSFGPLGDLAHQVLAAGTRDGDLFVWSTATPRCDASGPWPRNHHDLWNTSNLQESGVPAFACPS